MAELIGEEGRRHWQPRQQCQPPPKGQAKYEQHRQGAMLRDVVPDRPGTAHSARQAAVHQGNGSEKQNGQHNARGEHHHRRSLPRSGTPLSPCGRGGGGEGKSKGNSPWLPLTPNPSPARGEGRSRELTSAGDRAKKGRGSL